MTTYKNSHPGEHSPKAFERVEVHTLEVTCDGGGGALGHPKVYLHIDQDQGQISCPYCSRTYMLKPLSGGYRH